METPIAACLAAYLESFAPGDPNAGTAAIHVEHLLGYFGAANVDTVTKTACRVGYPAWRAIANAKRLRRRRTAENAARIPDSVPLSDGTIRRELGTLQAALNLAVGEGALTLAPPISMPDPPPARERWLRPAEARALLKACTAAHIKLFVQIALHTGARRGAVLDLTWPQIDLIGRKINFLKPGAKQTRKRRPIVPINGTLLKALKAAQKKSKSLHVVAWCGQKIRSVRTAFGEAVANAGLATGGRDAVTPHILRHTFATWAAQDGVPMHQIAGALGLTQKTAIEIYGHHHPDYMKDAGRAVAARLRATGT